MLASSEAHPDFALAPGFIRRPYVSNLVALTSERMNGFGHLLSIALAPHVGADELLARRTIEATGWLQVHAFCANAWRVRIDDALTFQALEGRTRGL
jgi:hypothetical protein